MELHQWEMFHITLLNMLWLCGSLCVCGTDVTERCCIYRTVFMYSIFAHNNAHARIYANVQVLSKSAYR